MQFKITYNNLKQTRHFMMMTFLRNDMPPKMDVKLIFSTTYIFCVCFLFFTSSADLVLQDTEDMTHMHQNTFCVYKWKTVLFL